MEVVQKNKMSYELKLLDLLGLKYYEIEQNKKWIIVDENDIEVGFIRVEEVGNIKNDLPLCYYTKIEKDEILYENIRVITSSKVKTNYDIKIKNNDQYDLISIDIGEFPHITVFSIEDGTNTIFLKNKKIVLNTSRKIDDFIISEKTELSLSEYNKKYSYITTFKNIKSQSKNITFSSIFIEKSKGVVKTYQKFEDNYNSPVEKHSTIESSLEEVILKNEKSINSINYFVNYIKNLLPFSNKVFQEILKNGNFEDANIKLLISIVDIKDDLPKIIKKSI